MRGKMYATTHPYTVDEKGKRKYGYKHWGTLDGNNKFHPTTTYFYATLEERRQLIFPSDWDLSELKSLSGTFKHPGVIAYEEDDVDRQYGTTWFLDRIAEKTGLSSDLKEVFGGNMEMVKDLLTLAYFPFVDDLSYSHLSQWQREVKAPSGRNLTSTAITRLCQEITEQNRMDLFRMRARRIGKDELCAVDSTSISTYGFNLVDIRWGHNKERLPLRQTLEVVVYSLTSHIPIYYKELPGNIPDSRTVELIMTEMEHAGFKNLVLVTDRGYESMKNLELYIRRMQKVITSVKVSQGEALEKIKSIDMSLGDPTGMSVDKKERVYYAQYDLEYAVNGNGGHTIQSDRQKLNLYYDPMKKGADLLNLRLATEEQKEAVESVIAQKAVISNPEDFAKVNNLLKITFNPDNTVKSYTRDREKAARKLLTSGFYANKTLGMDLTPMQAQDTYRMRDEQEKIFALQKGPLHQDRLHTWSETAKRGRMFICFCGLILASYVRKVRNDNEFLHKHFDSVESLLAEMRTIRCIEHKGHDKFITPFIGAQIDICSAFGLEIPTACAPTYVSRAKAPRKRGRPAKQKVES
jgi:transposase